MKPIDADIIAKLKELQGDIIHNMSPLNKAKRKLGRDKFVLAKLLNEVVDSGQYDVSPLEIDIRDLSVFSGHHAAIIRGMAELVFGGFWTRRRVPSRIKQAYQQEIAAIGNTGFIYVSSEVESQHGRIVRQRAEAENAEKRKQIKVVDVVRHRNEMTAAIKNKTLGPEYFPACYSAKDGTQGFFPWLKRQTPDVWHVAAECGFNGEEEELIWIASQPNCDRATAAVLFAESFGEYGGAYYLEQFQGSKSQQRRPTLFEVIGRRWQSGAYTRKNFAFDLDLWILNYRDDFVLIDNSDANVDWLIDPDELIAQDGAPPDCPFFIGDHSAYFKSQENADSFFGADAEGRKLQAWLND
ncbi:hypothetical protein [Thalassobius sp. I31.1]|uniref:hypothetical protein n=1 Tax=Thalassobius sp. I31.1 TaxID=2109912 RepID=UPI000D1A4C05|nr:hypothetical protein [Thalassobius sp. I31.1]